MCELVRIKVGARVRCGTPLRTIRFASPHQIISAQHFDKLEGLALARAWGSESPFRTNLRSRLSTGA
jgi:hypothetical protein